MAEPLSPEDRARRIKVLLFDVDGVLTDGDITIIPPLDGNPDGPGHGDQRLLRPRRPGHHPRPPRRPPRRHHHQAQIRSRRHPRPRPQDSSSSTRASPTNSTPSTKSSPPKAAPSTRLAYVGDDIVDLPVMRVCGLAIATANARPQAKAAAHYITPNPGGHGAGRDAIDFILTAQGKLDQAIEAFLDPDQRRRRIRRHRHRQNVAASHPQEIHHGDQTSRHTTFRQRTGRLVHRHGPHRSAFPGPRSRAASRRQRHLRARRAHRLAHASARPDPHRHLWLRPGAALGRPDRGDPPRRRRLVRARTKSTGTAPRPPPP